MLIQSGTGALTANIRQASAEKPPSGQSPVPKAPREGAIGALTDAFIDTGYFMMNEAMQVAANDPALALRYGATTISEKLLQGTGPTVRDGFGEAIVPTIRLSLLGANAYRLTKTFEDPGSHWAEKGLDIARVATDLVGLAGSVLKYIAPSRAALGDTLVGVAYAADSVSHSVRLMTHGSDRVKVWKKALAERKEAKTKQPVAEPPIQATEPVAAVAPSQKANPTLLLAT